MDRTRLQRDCDVLVCGASFAGLAVARELAGTGARVLVVDRYEIGERQTSACGIPTSWLMALELDSSLRQSFDALVVHTPFRTSRWQLPWSFSTFDYRELCALLWEQAQRADAGVRDRDGDRRAAATPSQTDRGELRAPLVVDALGWRRVLSNAKPIQPPRARLSRGLEVHPPGTGRDMELWLDAGYVRAGYSWSFPAGDELRVGVGSFWPSHHVKEPTVRLAGDLGLPAARLPGQLDPPPAAPGGGGRRLLRRRLGRPLPAADRRGHPHRALLRARAAAASCGRCSTEAVRASRRWPATPPSPTPTRASSAGCWRSSGRSARSPRAAPPARS